jgi:ATP-dependent exoDNAse (exonuclease V) beta subunit
MNIEIISAGAGSGKTFTLTERMVALLQEGMSPAGILATTFTKKAAAELQERVRLKLLEKGMTEAANELGEALIGTIHSIGTRLLQRFAFEAGVSPLVEIIGEGDGQRLFNESLSQVLTVERIERVNQLADRLAFTKKTYDNSFDWRSDIRALTEVARANNFSKEVLETSKTRSWESFSTLLEPAQTTDAVSWNNRLISAIDQTVAALEAHEADTSKMTKAAIDTLKGLYAQLKFRGELYWYEWVKIAKTSVAVKSRHLMEDLQELALRHDEHQQFRDDVKEYLDFVFDIASDALGEFEQYKKKRGLIDYTDMETYVSRLLRNESVRETLRGEIGLLLVDEFQDTSPIQLDIFLQLSQLAQHSIWVGDPKQSIYGFRGADPALMQAIIAASGGVKDENILKKSWRSRPDIVHAVNAIFTKAFTNLPSEQVVLEPAFQSEGTAHFSDVDTPGLALRHWHFVSEADERKAPGSPWFEQCIAHQISVFLAQKPLVYNKKRDIKREAMPGDIAVLCRNNNMCQQVAEALHRAGLKASISRAGLFETKEAKLALACLRYLLSASDALSVAEILILTGGMDLETMVNHRLEYLHQQRQEPNHLRWAADNVYLKKLNELRPRTADLSASEILGLVLEELDLRRVAVQFGHPNQRLDNLDRLRRYALDYETACNRLHSAASLGGFLLWANDVARSNNDAQGSGESEDAVKVLTYHRSKGLEYPVTICYNLEQNLRENFWGLHLVSEVDTPDLNNILGNRWLRFWINPYADQLGGTRLEKAAGQTTEWLDAQRMAREEEARLLYVGLTRARDYLVFPTNVKPTKWLNRVFNNGEEGIPTLDPNSQETPFYRGQQPILASTERIVMPTIFPESPADQTPVPFHSERKGKNPVPRANLLIDHAHEQPPVAEPQWGEPEVWGLPLAFEGEYQPAMAKAVQALLALDFHPIRGEDQLPWVKKQLEIRGVSALLDAHKVLAQMISFQRWLDACFAPTTRVAQFPLEAFQNGRQLKIDVPLYLEQEGQAVALMFAGYAEGMKKWKQQTQTLSFALGWCQLVLRQALPEKKLSLCIVFPLEGAAVTVSCP